MKIRYVYIYTNDGRKADILRSNPNVCLQVETVIDNGTWLSVLAEGTVNQITDNVEAEAILRLMNARITTPTPAMGITWVNNWISAKKEMIFKITIEITIWPAANKVGRRRRICRSCQSEEIADLLAEILHYCRSPAV
jgi:nitroimidazol reductase NimA-like FMN-containing flavoprotein (pyridoxamine 5'-phosphate oxidase superfamily)